MQQESLGSRHYGCLMGLQGRIIYQPAGKRRIVTMTGVTDLTSGIGWFLLYSEGQGVYAVIQVIHFLALGYFLVQLRR